MVLHASNRDALYPALQMLEQDAEQQMQKRGHPPLHFYNIVNGVWHVHEQPLVVLSPRSPITNTNIDAVSMLPCCRLLYFAIFSLTAACASGAVSLTPSMSQPVKLNYLLDRAGHCAKATGSPVC